MKAIVVVYYLDNKKSRLFKAHLQKVWFLSQKDVLPNNTTLQRVSVEILSNKESKTSF